MTTLVNRRFIWNVSITTALYRNAIRHSIVEQSHRLNQMNKNKSLNFYEYYQIFHETVINLLI